MRKYNKKRKKKEIFLCCPSMDESLATALSSTKKSTPSYPYTPINRPTVLHRTIVHVQLTSYPFTKQDVLQKEQNSTTGLISLFLQHRNKHDDQLFYVVGLLPLLVSLLASLSNVLTQPSIFSLKPSSSRLHLVLPLLTLLWIKSHHRDKIVTLRFTIAFKRIEQANG